MARSILPAALGRRRLPNIWDIAAVLCVFGGLVALSQSARGTFVPLSVLEASTITLDPWALPDYALRTTLRMFAALAASLLFTFTYAPLAAKSRRAGLIMVPILDILQSVPVLGFLTFTIAFFMSLFPGQVMGLELAAIFAIFTSQAWNMAFSFYQSLTTVPGDLDEACRGFRLTAWQRFWRLEVPFAMPGLVWNTMLSMSAGWFFVVASEAITLGDNNWKLPGIGSYVATALDQKDLPAIAWAILTMLLVILAYDQLLFRPLVAWSAKFRFETTASAEVEDPWMLRVIRRTHVLRVAGGKLGDALTWFGGLRIAFPQFRPAREIAPTRLGDAVFGV
jgi:NitT/TauT family transport system permease protein